MSKPIDLASLSLNATRADNVRFEKLGDRLRELDTLRTKYRREFNRSGADRVGEVIVRLKQRIYNILWDDPTFRV